MQEAHNLYHRCARVTLILLQLVLCLPQRGLNKSATEQSWNHGMRQFEFDLSLQKSFHIRVGQILDSTLIMSEGLDTFYKSWEARPITSLELVVPEQDPTPLLKLLPNVLKRNSDCLRSFRLVVQNMSLDLARPIQTELKNCAKLQKFSLLVVNCGCDGEFAELWSELLTLLPVLRSFFLGGDMLGNGACMKLAETIEKTPQLQFLGLWGRCIDNLGAKRMAEALGRCSGLRALSLAGGNMGDKGVAAIVSELRENVVSVFFGVGSLKDPKSATSLLVSGRKISEFFIWGPTIDDKLGDRIFAAAKDCATLSSLGVWAGSLGILSTSSASDALVKNPRLVSIYFWCDHFEAEEEKFFDFVMKRRRLSRFSYGGPREVLCEKWGKGGDVRTQDCGITEATIWGILPGIDKALASMPPVTSLTLYGMNTKPDMEQVKARLRENLRIQHAYCLFDSADEKSTDHVEAKPGCYVRTEGGPSVSAKYLAYVLMGNIIPRTEKLIGL